MMTWTYQQLKTAYQAISPVPANYTAAAVTLNAQTTTSAPLDLQWAAIRDVLMNDFDWGGLVQCVQTSVGGVLPGGATQTVAIQAAAIAIRECCVWGGTLNASNTTVWNKLTAAANLLTPGGVGGISAASANAVVAMRTPTVPAWSPAVTAGDVQTAVTQP
jgi:hypothetical protein